VSEPILEEILRREVLDFSWKDWAGGDEFI
jgi:hypothetical protein